MLRGRVEPPGRARITMPTPEKTSTEDSATASVIASPSRRIASAAARTGISRRISPVSIAPASSIERKKRTRPRIVPITPATTKQQMPIRSSPCVMSSDGPANPEPGGQERRQHDGEQNGAAASSFRPRVLGRGDRAERVAEGRECREKLTDQGCHKGLSCVPAAQVSERSSSRKRSEDMTSRRGRSFWVSSSSEA